MGNNRYDFHKYILDAGLRGCFDNISHQYIIKTLNTIEPIQIKIKAWLEAGIIYKNKQILTTENLIGTPQGGIISHFLANVVLHGMEEYLKNWITTFPEYGTSKQNRKKQIGIIRYADDFVIIHKDRYIIEEAKIALSQWLKNTSKLELNNKRPLLLVHQKVSHF